MATFDFFTPLSQLGNNIKTQWNEGVKQQSLAEMGKLIQGDDWKGAASKAAEMGDLPTLLGLMKLKQEREGGDALANSYANSAGGAPAAPSFTVNPSAAPSQPLAAAPVGAAPRPSVPTFARVGTPPEGIKAIINETSAKYGVNPDYMTRLAGVESSFNPNAVSSTGAKGLNQFVGGTAKQYGLQDPFDPYQNVDAGARLTLDNRKALASALGREPTSGELYLAHQQGAGGAIALLRNPNAPAESVVNAKAIRVNGGKPGMTAGQFAAKWTAKFDGIDSPVRTASADPSFAPQMGGAIPDQKPSPANVQQPPPPAAPTAQGPDPITLKMLRSPDPTTKAEGLRRWHQETQERREAAKPVPFVIKQMPNGEVWAINPKNPDEHRVVQRPAQEQAGGEGDLYDVKSVEGRALNELVKTGKLTREQAAQFGAGKTVTNAKGETVFMTPDGVFHAARAGGAQPGAAQTGAAPAPGQSTSGVTPATSTDNPGMIKLTEGKPEGQGNIGGELASRIGLGNMFLEKHLPWVREQIEAGAIDGVMGSTALKAKTGVAGKIIRRVEQGKEALIRNLTGAGMGLEEAKSYAEQYVPQWNEKTETIKDKLQLLEDALVSTRDAAIAGKNVTDPALKGSGGGERPAPKTQQPNAAPKYKDGDVAINPQTGETLHRVKGKWVPAGPVT